MIKETLKTSEYLKPNKPLIGRAVGQLIEKMSKPDVSGQENIPESGPFVVVSNHFGGKDAMALMSVFADKNIHMTAGKHSNMDMAWGSLARQLQMLTIDESLSNLSDEQLTETRKYGDKLRQKALDNTTNQNTFVRGVHNAQYVRDAVAMLKKGDAVSIFPEGVQTDFSEDSRKSVATKQDPKLRQAYRGAELIIKYYEKQTGEKLPVLPVAYLEKDGLSTISIGEPITTDDNDTELNFSDFAMTKVAELLPEENRGYYADKVK
jgi:1-acyl-sn-glycerol-3-phosphate acyltransferase